jgi:hypothetical protein
VCPAVVQKDCASWLETVEQGLPTVVLSVKDDAGRDLLEVNVSVDGHPLTSRLAGESQPLDPGLHTFHFESAAGPPIDQQVLVREGVKNQPVSVVFKGARPAAPGAPPPVAAAAADAAPAAESPSSAPWKTIGWIAGGAGIVGLGVGAVFGVAAISDKNGAHCDASDACDSGPLGSARSAATASTVGMVAGGVLLAGGVALVLFGPSGGGASTARLAVAPVVGARDAGLSLGGIW